MGRERHDHASDVVLCNVAVPGMKLYFYRTRQTLLTGKAVTRETISEKISEVLWGCALINVEVFSFLIILCV